MHIKLLSHFVTPCNNLQTLHFSFPHLLISLSLGWHGDSLWATLYNFWGRLVASTTSSEYSSFHSFWEYSSHAMRKPKEAHGKRPRHTPDDPASAKLLQLKPHEMEISHPQVLFNLKDHEQMNGSGGVKPLSFGVVCCVSVGNWDTP